MTINEREMQMYNCELWELDEAIADFNQPYMGGSTMLVMSILSDAQELIAMDAGDRARQNINQAKYVISKMRDLDNGQA
tara:strand:- start:1291 stop:1527 length:237 start_codon:yes stop_codon:yes gene_type:complete